MMTASEIANLTIELHDALGREGRTSVSKSSGRQAANILRALADRLGCDLVNGPDRLHAIAPRFMDGARCTDRIMIPIEITENGWISDWDSDAAGLIDAARANAFRTAARLQPSGLPEERRACRHGAGIGSFQAATSAIKVGDVTMRRFAELLNEFLDQLS